MTSDDQRKLEDIRRKLKDIFVTGEKAPPPKEETIKAGEGQTASSGLLDLRDLAKSRRANSAESEPRVDDDMLLLSGGLFDGPRGNQSLAPPDLSQKAPPAPKPPPPTRAAQPEPPAEVEEVEAEPDLKALLDEVPKPKPESKAKLKAAAMTSAPVDDEIVMPKPALTPVKMAAIGIAFLALLGGVFYAVMHTGSDEATDAQGNTRVGADVTTQGTAGTDVKPGEAKPQASAAPDSQPASVIVPGGKASASASASAKSDSPTTAGKKPASGDKEPSTGPASPVTKTDAPPASTPTVAAPPPPPAETAKAAPPPPPAADEFSKSAASAALSAAASRAASCKGDGPSGSATVSVTFAPSGRVTSARVEGGTFAGTPTGGCIATAFRGASVPPFGGSPVTVKKTVSIR
jgi:hypothetical protein